MLYQSPCNKRFEYQSIIKQKFMSGGLLTSILFLKPWFQWLRKIAIGELTEEGICFFVVGHGSFDFACIRADIYFSAIELDSDFPFFPDFIPFKAFIFWVDFCFGLRTIAEILWDGRGAEIGLSIIEAVAVYMVAEHVFRDVDNLTMHPYLLS